MGFFADIIRDSRREGTATRAFESPVVSTRSDTSIIRLREEGGGQPVSAPQTPVQDGTPTRRDLAPSLTEHPPISGLHGLTTEGAALPDPGTREQGGRESARTVTVMSDSFIRESSSGEAMSRIGDESEASQVKRQTEVTTAFPAEADEEASDSPAVSMESDTAEIRFREEGGGQPLNAGLRTPQDGGAVTRRVVGLSPSEYTPGAGIPEVTMKGVSLPNPVARKQAGCESARTETDSFRVEQMKSFHDGDSIDAPLVPVDASDSFVRESSSGDAESRAGKVSVETQGRRQAGLNRAGSTTSLDQSTEIRTESNDGEQAAGLPGKTFQSVGRALFADETRHEPLHGVKPATALSSPPASEGAERFHRATRRPLPAIPKENDKQGSGRSLPPPEPQVRIGTIEVVVVAPEPADRSHRSEERSRPDLASRHYLRNF
jgi:hypothetical protein